MFRRLAASLAAGVAVAILAHAPAASAATLTTTLSCKGAILGFTKLGDHRLATYQDGHGHRIELWCTRRIFDSQFDLRIAVGDQAPDRGGRQQPAAPGRLATVGGCFFDDGDNDGPIIVRAPNGAYARLEWITEDPTHQRKYRFSYDFASGLDTITTTVAGCTPVSKVVAPQPSYRRLRLLLPHPPPSACADGAVGNFDPSAPTP